MHATPSQLLPELKVLEPYGGDRGELHTGYLSDVVQESWGHYLCSEERSLGEERAKPLKESAGQRHQAEESPSLGPPGLVCL